IGDAELADGAGRRDASDAALLGEPYVAVWSRHDADGTGVGHLGGDDREPAARRRATTDGAGRGALVEKPDIPVGAARDTARLARGRDLILADRDSRPRNASSAVASARCAAAG